MWRPLFNSLYTLGIMIGMSVQDTTLERAARKIVALADESQNAH